MVCSGATQWTADIMSPEHSPSRKRLTHYCFKTLDAKLVLERDRKAVKRADGFPMGLEVVIDFFRPRKSTVDKYLCQTVGLLRNERS